MFSRTRRLLLGGLLLTMAASGAAQRAARIEAQAPLRSAEITLTTVDDWQRGALLDGLLVSNNEGGDTGGELRMSEDRLSGEFVSAALPISTTGGAFAATAVGAVWQAEVPSSTGLALEVRGGPGPDGPWSGWQALPAGDTRSQDDGALASESVRALPPATSHLQIRATFTSEAQRASALLSGVTLYAFDSLAGPASALGLDKVPVAYGEDVLTPRPTLTRRESWSPAKAAATGGSAAPKAIVLHQTGSLGTSEVVTSTAQPLMVLRALAAYQSESLGWGDMAYHYLVDREGNLYEGRQGGPASLVTQFSGVVEPAVHVALLGDFDEEPTQEARTTLARLVAWLGQSYGLPPLGEHSVRLGQTTTTRPNLVAHSEAVPDAADPGEALRALMPELRQEADAATVRARTFFAEGNTVDYEERLALFNPSDSATVVRVVQLRPGDRPVLQEVELAAGARADLDVNAAFGSTPDVPLIVEASQPVVSERIMRRLTEIDGETALEFDGGSGASAPARAWYFAEGSTDNGFATYFALFNPQTQAVSATLTYMRGDGRTTAQQVSVPPLGRTVVTASDVVPNVGFGTRVVASLPIVAERTVLFGENRRGFHISAGQASLSRRWLFAEGTTDPGFEMRILLLNPNTVTNTAELTFATPDGTSTRRQYALPPTSRLVVNVNDVVPQLGVATQVEANRPLVAERALYFEGGNAGTAGIGATEPAFVWRFADGRTTEGDQTFLLVSNPNRGQAQVTVDVVLEDGARDTQGFLMPGNSRYTFAVHDFYPGQNALAATVRATQPVVVERSLFRQNGDAGGYTALGAPSDD